VSILCLILNPILNQNPIKINRALISVFDKTGVVELAQSLTNRGVEILSTGGTAKHLQAAGLDVVQVKKVSQGRPHIVDAMKNGQIALVFNTTWGKQALKDSYSLRRAALMGQIPYFTTAAGARAAVSAITTLAKDDYDVMSLQDYG